MTGSNRFGPAVGRAQVRGWAREGLRLWLPDYLRESERVQGYPLGRTALPNSWQVADDLAKWPDQQLPAIVVQVPGLARGGEPVREGDGSYRARWAVALTAIARGRDEDERDWLGDVYELALRMLFLQQATSFRETAGYAGPAVDAETAEWSDSGTDDLPQRPRTRTLVAATATFRVGMRGLATDMTAPDAPRLDPLPDAGPWPDVETADVTTEHSPEGVGE